MRPKAKVGVVRRGLDHDRVAQPLPQALDPRLEVRLVVLGDVVLGVLLEVAELARREEAFAHRAPPVGLELLELGLQRLQAGGVIASPPGLGWVRVGHHPHFGTTAARRSAGCATMWAWQTALPPAASRSARTSAGAGPRTARGATARPPRPPDISVRCRVLTPSDHLRYSPGSLLVIVSPSSAERDRFAERLIQNQASLLSLDKVRALLAGRVPEEEVDDRAQEILNAAIQKRLEAGETVVIAAEGMEADERERYARMAAGCKRPRHLLLLEAARGRTSRTRTAPP